MISRWLQLVLALLLAGCASSLAGRAPLPEPSSAPIERVQLKRPVVALVLGSGGARGFAHVGVIKSLEAEGIQPDIVVGASSGAIVAALYAAGLNGQQLHAIANQLDESDLIDINPFDGFRIRGERIARFVTESVDHRPMEALPRAFAVVATDAETGKMMVFNRGDPGLAVRASSSVPRLFVPPAIRGRQYVDGGLVSPVPVKLARAMGADIVIAVDISRFAPSVGPAPAGAAAADPGARWSRRALLEAELAQASVVIRPVLARTQMLDFDYKQAHLAAGEAAVHGALAKLREVLAAARGTGNGTAAQ